MRPRSEARWRDPRVEQWLRRLVFASAAALLLLFLFTVASRIRAPFELEQNEGYMALSVNHMFHGGALYPRPNFTFLANMYPAFYYYASLTVAKAVGGVSLAVLRGVSLGATLLTLALIAMLVRAEEDRTRRLPMDWLPRVAGAALYLSLYRECQGWFDLGRVDSFYVMMTLLALWVTRKAHPVVAAVFWVLAVQTKQPILPVAVLMLCHDYRRVGRTLAGLAVFFAGVVVSYALIDHATGGWYSLYILREPKANAGLLLRPGFTFLPENVLAPLGIACLVLTAAVLLVPGRWASRATRFWLTAVGSTVLLTWYQMMHNGSAVNVLMPMYAVLAAAFGVALLRLLERSPAFAAGEPARGLLLLAVVVQLLAGGYNPGLFKPSAALRATAAALQAQLHAIPGDVYVVEHAYPAVMAGKPEHPDEIALEETLRAMKPADAGALRAKIAAELCGGGMQGLVLDGPEGIDTLGEDLHIGGQLRAHYGAPMVIPGAVPTQRASWLLLPRRDVPPGCTVTE